MWALENGTPFAVGRSVVIDKNGEKHWIVAVKGTFEIAPSGATEIAQEQLEVQVGPKFAGDAAASSLVYDQDLTAVKPRTDLYLNASAHAPGGRPAVEVPVGLKTPRGLKALVVRGDRQWDKGALGARVIGPIPFLKMPITYERAFGGYDRTHHDPSKHRLDARNPVGTGFFTQAEHRVGKRMPNVEFPDGAVNRGPAGFGALAGSWEPRTNYAGTYDAKWVDERKPLLPADYDPLFLQCAPADQQFAPYLQGGEAIDLVNLTPEGRLHLTLPRHHFGFTTQIGQKQHHHSANLDTVIIEPDARRLIMVWRSALSCHHDIDNIDFTRVFEKSSA